MCEEITLSILLQNPVDGLLYGLQKGKGALYETVQAQRGNGNNLLFHLSVPAKPAKGPSPSLGGPFVQGTPGNRFLYITIGSYAGQHGTPHNGRLKVPLNEGDFQAALAKGGACSWSCTVPGRTKEGKPVFATVKPFDGWRLNNASD